MSFFSRNRRVLGALCGGFHRNVINRNLSSSFGENSRTVKLSYDLFETMNLRPSAADNSPLVIIHGLFGSKQNWKSLAKGLSKSGRKVVTVDARNHGESPHVPDMDYFSMSEDIELLMSDLKLENATVLGHSMGGKIAMVLALTKPSLVHRLVVVDVSPETKRSIATSHFPEYIAAMKRVQFDPSQSLIYNRKLADQQLESTFPDQGIRNFVLTNLEERNDEIQWRVNLDAINKNLQRLIAFPKIDSSYSGDTLFIGGTLSHHIREDTIPEIKRLFPTTGMEFVEGAGHWVHSEKPHDFLKIVNKFLGSTKTFVHLGAAL